ncbi:Mitochondrial distribution and morphology protein 10 [Collariella sp. IMI 366227]|nr:Mitochondrial distribution and morphology protein 10 [Collariella sp. IMI 366227]
MREFMHYITNAFYGATGWNEDNTYKELNVTARELIDFPLPRGLRLTLSSLATPHFATSYQLGSIGIVDGSISYLHSTVPLTGITAQSDRIPLPALLRSYRRLHDLGSPTRSWYWGAENTSTEPAPPAVAPPDLNTNKAGSSLLYGRLYLPQSLLEGLVVRRLTPALQVQLSAVSERSLRNGGTLLGLIQYDKGKYGVEGLASTDGGLLGVRGLYNIGGDCAKSLASSRVSDSNGDGNGQPGEKDAIYGRFSVGGEGYYGTLNKSAGMSLGARFATLPSHRGTPLTATLTINPLMGNINATYAVLAKDYCSLATRVEFNVYSYESEWAVGMELWSNRRPAGFLLGADPNRQPEPAPEPTKRKKERSFQAKMEWRLDDPEPELELSKVNDKPVNKEKYRGVLKARLDQNLRIGLLWEGRVKSLIFSLGTGVDLRKLGEPFRSLGLEVQYSS